LATKQKTSLHGRSFVFSAEFMDSNLPIGAPENL
jgi:hypothetical protein